MNDPRPAVDPAACAVATSAPETPRTYSLELVAELTGITIHQVLAYQEDGLVLPVAGPAGMGGYDDDAVMEIIANVAATAPLPVLGIGASVRARLKNLPV